MNRPSSCLRIAMMCAISVLSLCGMRAAAVADDMPDDVRVTTLAGSGALGMADGDAHAATFMLPAGLAADRKGTIFVSDEGAQRVRAITNGEVTTVAGSGDPGYLGFSVPGGYLDGPALAAKFDHPLGMTVGPDGALYIADSQNAAIRKLQNGVVSTIVGRPESVAPVDGDAATARLAQPRALAFDADGNLWVADGAGGLRYWNRGRLTTIALGPSVRSVLSVAVTPDDDEVLAVTPTAIVRYAPRTHTIDTTSSGTRLFANADEEYSNEFGTPSAIAGIGRGQAVFSDLLASNIRYVRFPQPPFVIAPYTREIAGGAFERRTDDAGFADGAAADARFAEPRGLIVANSSVIVADSANRRIRIFKLPEFRTPEVGNNSAYAYDTKHFEVALVGASIAYFDSHGGDSMCAAVERRFDASDKLVKPARCHSVRIDAARIPQLEDYVEANLAFRPLDLVVLSIAPGFVFDLDRGNATESLVRFRESIAKVLDALKPSHAKLAIFWQYPDTTISNREQLGTREIDPRYDALTADAAYRIDLPIDSRVMKSLEGLNVTSCDSFDAAVAYEKGTGRTLYSASNGHYVDRGNVFFGTLLGDCLVASLAGTAR